ncbi:MAG: hypothetical protein WDO13_08025 [Verrucomicrobiota bacterium]
MTLGGIALTEHEFGAAEIQAYVGPDKLPPGEAPEADWKTVLTLFGLKSHYAAAFDLLPLAFDAPVTTRALRLRFTAAVGPPDTRARDGRRVALGQWMALQPLDEKPLADALIPVAVGAAHAPIPIRSRYPRTARSPS